MTPCARVWMGMHTCDTNVQARAGGEEEEGVETHGLPEARPHSRIEHRLAKRCKETERGAHSIEDEQLDD